jgi:hypothetical protein
MRLRTAVCAGLGVLLACKGSERGGVPVGGKVLLRYHPPSGANYRYVMDQDSKIAFDSGAMGKMPDQQITMTMFMTQAVGAPAESGFSVVTTIDSSKIGGPLGALAGPMAEQTKGARTTMVFDSRLHVLHADFTGLPGVSPQMAQQMNGGFRGMIFEFPEAAVGAGDTWTTNLELPFAQFSSASAPLTASTKLTVREVLIAGGDTTVRLGVVTTFPENPISIDAMGGQMTLRMSGTLTGEQVFSLTRGTIVTTTMTGTIHAMTKGGVLGAQGLAVTVTQNGSMKLVEK